MTKFLAIPLLAVLAAAGCTSSTKSTPTGMSDDHPAMKSDKPAGMDGMSGMTPADSKAAPTQMATYTCSMHPEVTSDKPGTCPKCGMALVKKE